MPIHNPRAAEQDTAKNGSIETPVKTPLDEGGSPFYLAAAVVIATILAACLALLAVSISLFVELRGLTSERASDVARAINKTDVFAEAIRGRVEHHIRAEDALSEVRTASATLVVSTLDMEPGFSPRDKPNKHYKKLRAEVEGEWPRGEVVRDSRVGNITDLPRPGKGRRLLLRAKFNEPDGSQDERPSLIDARTVRLSKPNALEFSSWRSNPFYDTREGLLPLFSETEGKEQIESRNFGFVADIPRELLQLPESALILSVTAIPVDDLQNFSAYSAFVPLTLTSPVKPEENSNVAFQLYIRLNTAGVFRDDEDRLGTWPDAARFRCALTALYTQKYTPATSANLSVSSTSGNAIANSVPN